MRPTIFVCIAVLLLVAGIVMLDHHEVRAGEVNPTSGYKVLDPIHHGNLTVFPVVANKSYPTGEFLTLDEGLHSGEVVVTEAGSVQGLVRRHGTPVRRYEGAEVNRLVLVNNSKRPLLLLAGEIVSGGKQDRVIGKDRIVPPESDPIDLSVFCVEPGRWVATTEHFGASEALYGKHDGKSIGGPVPMAAMVQPSVRGKAGIGGCLILPASRPTSARTASWTRTCSSNGPGFQSAVSFSPFRAKMVEKIWPRTNSSPLLGSTWLRKASIMPSINRSKDVLMPRPRAPGRRLARSKPSDWPSQPCACR